MRGAHLEAVAKQRSEEREDEARQRDHELRQLQIMPSRTAKRQSSTPAARGHAGNENSPVSAGGGAAGGGRVQAGAAAGLDNLARPAEQVACESQLTDADGYLVPPLPRFPKGKVVPLDMMDLDMMDPAEVRQQVE